MMEFHGKEDVCNGNGAFDSDFVVCNGAFNSDFVRRNKEALKHSLKKHDDSKILVLNNGISTVRTIGKDLLIAILEDSNEEVIKIPKAFENWMKRNEGKNKENYLNKIIQKIFRSENRYEPLGRWIHDNPKEISNLYKVFVEGAEYELLKEYEIKIPGFVSENGEQYLTYAQGNYFACAKNHRLKQKFYEDELQDTPEYYRQFAKEV